MVEGCGAEDEMIGWHLGLNGWGFEQAAGDSEGQGSGGCRCPLGLKELDTLRLNNNNVTKSIKTQGGPR